MLEFKKLNLDILFEIDKYFKQQPFRICDYTFGTAYMWMDFFKCRYAIENDMLFMINNVEGKDYYSFPVGDGDVDKALAKIEEHAIHYGRELQFAFVPLEGLEKLQAVYQEKLTFSYTSDDSDYLYLAHDLIALEGYDHRHTRNRVSKYIRTYGKPKYFEITLSDIEPLINFLNYYEEQHKQKGLTYEVENEQTINVLKNYQKFNFIGGYLAINEIIIGFAVGEIANDTMHLHIMKALSEYVGAYQVLLNEFVKRTCNDQIEYVNLQEDMGDLGLRQAKRTYNPLKMLDKYQVFIKLNR